MANKILIEQAIQIRPGDHMVILYEKEEEAEDYLAAFMHASLTRNERCIYITGDADTEQVLTQMKGMDLEHLERGDLVVLNRSEAYAKEGKFNPDRMIKLIQEASDEAIADGYTGLSITGEISWVLDYDNGRELIIEYEWKLNERVFNQYPVSALCRYNMNRFTDDMIINVIQVHPFIIWKRMIHENPFYIPPEGYKNQEISKYQVKVWLENIQSFTNEKSRLQRVIDLKERELELLHKSMTDGIIKAMSGLLSVHDAYTTNHSDNVAMLSRDFAEYLQLTEEMITKLYYAGLAHDIGKTLIPSELLNKSDFLTDDEWNTIKMHPIYGAMALEKANKLEDITNAVRNHHERWDGAGYPDGLKGDQIPLMSRILALADTFDAMTNDRPYRKAFSDEIALAEIEKCSGKQFDPDLAEAFVKHLKNQIKRRA
jgi:HD-GYP domain-containing protein (c-di-GMP phosphodiesterase class II)